MVNKLKISAKLPKGRDAEGTEPLADHFMANPEKGGVGYVVMAVHPHINHGIRGADLTQVEVIIGHLEGLAHPDDIKAVQNILERAQRRRLNGDTGTPAEQPMMDFPPEPGNDDGWDH